MMTEQNGYRLPFDNQRLDLLMEEARLDALIMTSKHSIQYVFGGYRYHFHSLMDAIGLSRYLPALVYRQGDLDRAAYFGNGIEAGESDNPAIWVSHKDFSSMTSSGCARAVAEYLGRIGCTNARIGIEKGFLPADAFCELRSALPQARFTDATFTIELLRACKSPAELAKLKKASEGVIAAIVTTFDHHGPGATKNDLIESVRGEEMRRGLNFEYCLASIGRSFNRSPSDQLWKVGDVVCLDSGGNYQGYVGDLARMCVDGEPDQELQDALGIVDEIQQAARVPIRSGIGGGEIFDRPRSIIDASPYRERLEFVAHGMGIVSHEAPWLTENGPVPYPAYHADRPLEEGMVLSIETTLFHESRGFIKLEDTVAVTSEGYEAFGDWGRGWN